MRLPTELTTQLKHLVQSTIESNGSLLEVKAAIEAVTLETTLSTCKYNQSKTALTLGVARGTVRQRLRTFFGSKYL